MSISNVTSCYLLTKQVVEFLAWTRDCMCLFFTKIVALFFTDTFFIFQGKERFLAWLASVLLWHSLSTKGNNSLLNSWVFHRICKWSQKSVYPLRGWLYLASHLAFASESVLPPLLRYFHLVHYWFICSHTEHILHLQFQGLVCLEYFNSLV